jgi:hypothetical protein
MMRPDDGHGYETLNDASSTCGKALAGAGRPTRIVGVCRFLWAALRKLKGRSWLLVFLSVFLVGCGYTPPNSADSAKPTYRSDLSACETSGDKEAHRLVMSSGLLFLTYPFSLPIEESRQVRTCMEKKGYAAK